MISIPLHDFPWSFRQAGHEGWLPATVPGCVHTDLRANDLIPDPFWGDNELRLRWIEEVDWEYRCEFMVDDAQLRQDEVDLVFEGLDTVCTITLNGTELGRTANMFTGWRFPVRSRLREGANLLELRFHN